VIEFSHPRLNQALVQDDCTAVCNHFMFVSNRVTTCLENVETVHVRELNISHGGVIEKGEVREIQGILYCMENGNPYSKLVVVFFS